MELITTWNGLQEKKEDCVFIRGKYYHKKNDCKFHNGIYYSPFSRYCLYDNEIGEKKFSLECDLKYGVIGIDGSNLKFGYFSPNMLRNGLVFISEKDSTNLCKELALVNNPRNIYLDILERISQGVDIYRDLGGYPHNTTVPCMDVWKLFDKGYKAAKADDMVFKKEDIKHIPTGYKKLSARAPYAFDLAYNCETMLKQFQKQYDECEIINTKDSPQMILSKELGDFTYGIEYESWDGRIPTYIAAATGLIPLRDGSLRHDGICGYEYASVVMSGDKGLDFIKSQCKALNDFTEFNEKCSMHIHIGNIPKSKEALVNLMKGMVSIQDDLYNMFPSCLKDTSVYKQKSYCSPLNKELANVDANSIVRWMSCGKDGFDKFGKHHPLDPGNQSKWNIPSRYCIINFNNFYYTNRGTLELRISTPTFNHNKVVALLIIFSILIKSALKEAFYTDVETAIKESGLCKKDMDWILGYIKYRKEVLNKFELTDRGVFYYEKQENDGETGEEQDLY